MSALWETLLEVRGQLAAVPGVQSCKIGLETPIVAEDYPIIRLVPSLIRTDEPRGGIDVIDPLLVYYGWNLLEVDSGLEVIYQTLFDMREQIRTILTTPDEWPLVWQYKDTVMDEDRLPRYKMFVDRYSVIE